MRTPAALTACLLLAAALTPVPAALATAPPRPSPQAGAPAPEGMTWAVRPTGPKGPSGRDHFVYNASPGQVIRDQVTISNLGEETLTFRVYATDAFNTADGSFALLTADRTATQVGRWVRFESGSYQIKAGKTRDVPFTLTVPRDVTPGDHGGGVIASVTQQRTDAQGRRVNVDRRVAARIYLRADGPVTPALQISALRTGYSAPALGSGRMNVTYTVRNTGNVRVTALARIRARGPFGVPLGEQVSRRVPELLPGNSYTFTERLPGVVPAGLLTSSVALSPTDPQNGAPVASRPLTREASVWNVPWLPLGALVLLVAGAWTLYRRRPRASR